MSRTVCVYYTTSFTVCAICSHNTLIYDDYRKAIFISRFGNCYTVLCPPLTDHHVHIFFVREERHSKY